MGSGDDTFVWDPGDGSDVVEGQDGNDTMVFNGAAAAEQVDVSANGSRLRFFRNPGNITMDTAGVETVDFNALGGADVVTVNDLTGTDVTSVNVDLAGTIGGTAGDGEGRPRHRQRHRRRRRRSPSAATHAASSVSGLPAARWRFSTRSRPTSLSSTASAATTAISAAGSRPGQSRSRSTAATATTRIAGGAGIETSGRRRRQRLDRRQRGHDVALMGAGDDTFVWDPGDGSDVVEGQDGSDTMVFNGAAAAEQVDVSANGNRLRFFRNPGNITMDTAGVETVDFNALGGTDTVTVNDLIGTGVQASTSTSPARSAGGTATAQPTGSSSTAPPATTPSRSAEMRRA